MVLKVSFVVSSKNCRSVLWQRCFLTPWRPRIITLWIVSSGVGGKMLYANKSCTGAKYSAGPISQIKNPFTDNFEPCVSAAIFIVTVFLFAYHAVIVWMYITRTIYSTVGISEKWGPLNEVPLETLRATTNLEAIHYCQRNCVCTIHCMMVCVVSFN